MKDVFGRDINLGDTIAFAAIQGQSAELKFYRVEIIKENEGILTCREFMKGGWRRRYVSDNLVDEHYNPRRVGISDCSRMMVIPTEFLENLDTHV